GQVRRAGANIDCNHGKLFENLFATSAFDDDCGYDGEWPSSIRFNRKASGFGNRRVRERYKQPKLFGTKRYIQRHATRCRYGKDARGVEPCRLRHRENEIHLLTGEDGLGPSTPFDNNSFAGLNGALAVEFHRDAPSYLFKAAELLFTSVLSYRWLRAWER